MWIIGIVALSQVVCLPGAVLFRLLRVSGLNPFEQIAGVFAASLVTNCIVVTLLVSVGLHTPAVWWVIILAEVAYLLTTRRRRYPRWRFEPRWLGALRTMPMETALAGILLIAVLLVFVSVFHTNWGSVYVGNDAVANWDRWAAEWSRNAFPTRTSIYPQLLPANGSISYVLLGRDDVKLFSKATTPLYSLMTILLFLSLAIRRRDPSCLWGGAAFGFLVVHYTGVVFATYGYADLPLAFFGFLAFYCVYRREGGPSGDEVLAGLFASFGALLTKQGGIYVPAAMALYALYWHLQQKKAARETGTAPPRIFGRNAPSLLLAAVCLFTAVWYAAKFVQISRGDEYSNLELLTEVLHQGRSYGQRLVAAWQMFFSVHPYTGPSVTAATAGLMVASLFIRRTRAMTVFLLAPFLLLYGIYFSYAIRNALLAFPLIALICGETVHQLAGFPPKPGFAREPYAGVILAAIGTALFAGWLLTGEPGRSGLPDPVIRALTNSWMIDASRLFGIPALVTALLALGALLVPWGEAGGIEVGRLLALGFILFVAGGAAMNSRDALVASQTRLARTTIGDPAVNDRLYDLIQQRRITAGIVTDYWFLEALPGIKQFFRRSNCSAPCTVEGLRKSVYAYPDAGFALTADRRLAPETRQKADQGGEFQTLFLIDGLRLVQVNREPEARAAEHDGRR